MKDKNNKYLNDLSQSVFKKAALEQPSFNFTDAVMQNINASTVSKPIVYKPLITKNTWFFIALVFVGLFVLFALFGVPSESPGWLSSISFSYFSDKAVAGLFSGFSLSKTFTYAFILFGIMFCVQIPFIKQFCDKKITTL
jgi:hypothetical protein